MSAIQSERRLAVKIGEREQYHKQHEELLRELDGAEMNDAQKGLAKDYIERMEALDVEVAELAGVVDSNNKAEENSKAIKRALAGGMPGVESDEDGIIYRDFRSYAFDFFVTRTNVREAVKITRQWGVTEEDVQAARQRLDMVKRVPANTLSSNVGGLIPPQHIADIFQMIDKSRNLVNAARRADLERGTLTYPVIATPPVVAAQGAQKTEAGNTGLVVDMVTATASTYLGGGDLSWQAINWSTPSALQLWFDLVAADYALKTETDAATVTSASAFLNNIASPIAGTPTYAQLMAAVGAGGAEVFANSGRMANAVIMAPDRYWYALGLTSDNSLNFGQSALLNVSAEEANLRVIVSRGLNAGEIIVGDTSALLVAETPGAPVEMQVVEPAIGGVEVGLIGAFEAAVVDDGAFALITSAS